MSTSSGQGDTFATFTSPGGTPKITSIFDFSSDALAQLRLWLEQNPPVVPITSIVGFSQFTAQAATGSGSSGTAAGHAVVTGAGPQLANLGTGSYVVLLCADLSAAFSGEPTVSFATTAGPSVTVQGGPTVGSFAKFAQWTNTVQGASITTQWTADNSANAGSFSYGISGLTLIALKYSN